MKKVRLYNTLSREIENFHSIEEGLVKMYSCGPTVYSYPHIGNMRAYVFSDLLKRTLQYAGYEVINAINITDVGHLTSDADDGDDKLEKEAKKLNKDAYEVAKYFEDIFMRYLKDLNISEANIYPKATDHIQEQIDMVSTLEKKGYTYVTSDGVYFDTSKFKTYNDFAKINVEGLNDGHRVTINNEKLNKTDFALWKFSNPEEQRQMEWDSPWGIGFPGWHVECSAMIMKHLGEQIDIHTGGIDHIPIHHTNEIAQTEAYTGKKFSNFWLHLNFLQIEKKDESDEEEKMSKSKGNIVTVDSLKDVGISPMVLKYYYLTGHYRSELKYNNDILQSAKNTFTRMQEKVKAIKELEVEKGEYQNSVTNLLEGTLFEDLNTPRMFSFFQEILNNPEISTQDKKESIAFVESVTGLIFNIEEQSIPEEVISLAEARLTARNDKNWALSDTIRDEITALGFSVKDDKKSYELKKL
jgi:cysteinyl-tRNA synthetase